MFIIDEFDEILKVKNNSEDLDEVIGYYFKEIGINPMYAFYSATLDDESLRAAESYINHPIPCKYLALKNSLCNDNIMHLKLKMPNDLAKRKFLEDLFLKTPA